MIGTKSWREDYWGAEPNSQEVEKYFVEYGSGGVMDLYDSYQDLSEACHVALDLEEKGFDVKLVNHEGVNFSEWEDEL